jgi:hypothetical protein
MQYLKITDRNSENTLIIPESSITDITVSDGGVLSIGCDGRANNVVARADSTHVYGSLDEAIAGQRQSKTPSSKKSSAA